jgi:UDPglucose--hexose-1-phosphate uridylyltransferase
MAGHHSKPELRKDPILDTWVIIAPERAKRPVRQLAEPPPDRADTCPFCEGHEARTPHEILAYRDPNAGTDKMGWRIRVVPNKYPALENEGDLRKQSDDLYEQLSGIGAHEVIVECPFHETRMANLEVENIREVIRVYRDRLIGLKGDCRFEYGMIFKNVGVAAGATLEHSHSQLIALPIVPIKMQQELDGALTFFERRGRCVYCEMIQHELAAVERRILFTPNFVALAPYASRFPFETWILPRNHSSHFEHIREAEINELGTILKTILQKLDRAATKPAYNYLVHTAPLREQATMPHYHWHIEILPRLTGIAGFEWGTGCYVNPVPPEQAAKLLREMAAKSTE